MEGRREGVGKRERRDSREKERKVPHKCILISRWLARKANSWIGVDYHGLSESQVSRLIPPLEQL